MSTLNADRSLRIRTWRAPGRALAVLVMMCSIESCTEPPDPAADGGLDAGTEDAAVEDTQPDAVVEDGGIDASPGDADVDDSSLSDADGEATDDADPDAPDDTEAAPESGPDAPYPPVCGDGWRDPSIEECDDGLDDTGDTDQACGANCVVRDRIASTTPDIRERRLGAGRHPLASGDYGHAVAFVELVQPEAGGEVRVGVAQFSPVGERRGQAIVPGALYDADPVIAALPDGNFALAYTSVDADGDGLGVSVAIVDDGTIIGPVGHANATTEFGQHSPDMIWTGTALVLGWVDESTIPRRLCTRQFSSSLQPFGTESVLGSGNVSSLVLSPFSGGYVVAWREEALDQDGDLQARVVVSRAGANWSSADLGLPSADEKTVVEPIDPGHVLVAYSNDAGIVYGVVLDATMQAVWGPQPLTEATMSSHTPAVAVTADGVFLAYLTSTDTPDPDAGWDPDYDDAWVRKIIWDGATMDTSQPSLQLPHDPWTWDGDQRRPALVAAPCIPSGAVFAAWEDFGQDNYAGQAPHGDVVVSLIPTPILRGAW